ncbi:hypothetical protein ACQKMN_05060 [Ureibacillus composti]
MFRSLTVIQYACILAISFVSGVVCFQAFSMDKSMKLIGYIDPRVLDQTDISLWQTILPLVVSIVVVLVFATNPYIQYFARFVVAIRITFFGFSSVFLLTQSESMLTYSAWWFPFQLVYAILLLMLCSVYGTRKVGPNRKHFFSKKLFIFIIACLAIVCAGEVVTISYIFK